MAPNSVIAPAVSAQKPPTGWSLVILLPMVFTMRQPPNSVPSAIAAWQMQDRPTAARSNVRASVARRRPAAPVMMPMVFWASLPPWPRL